MARVRHQMYVSSLSNSGQWVDNGAYTLIPAATVLSYVIFEKGIGTPDTDGEIIAEVSLSQVHTSDVNDIPAPIATASWTVHEAGGTPANEEVVKPGVVVVPANTALVALQRIYLHYKSVMTGPLRVTLLGD